VATECPVNTVDEHAARTVAAIVVILAAASFWGAAWPLVVVLAADFTIRGLVDRRCSPLRWIAKGIVGAIGLHIKSVYAPPKRFAAQVGATLTIAASVLHLAGLHVAALIVTAVLIVAASLEAGFGFCLACWLYPYVFRFRGEARA
jgi:hypothetical protein